MLVASSGHVCATASTNLLPLEVNRMVHHRRFPACMAKRLNCRDACFVVDNFLRVGGDPNQSAQGCKLSHCLAFSYLPATVP